MENKWLQMCVQTNKIRWSIKSEDSDSERNNMPREVWQCVWSRHDKQHVKENKQTGDCRIGGRSSCHHDTYYIALHTHAHVTSRPLWAALFPCHYPIPECRKVVSDCRQHIIFPDGLFLWNNQFILAGHLSWWEMIGQTGSVIDCVWLSPCQ